MNAKLVNASLLLHEPPMAAPRQLRLFVRAYSDALEANPLLVTIFEKENQQLIKKIGIANFDLFAEAQRDLPHIWAQYPELAKLISQAHKNPEALNLVKASILLYARSYGETRKHSPLAVWHHSFRIAEEYIKIAREYKFDIKDIIQYATVAILHDTREDFHTHNWEVASLFGNTIASSTRRMTTPRTHVLAWIYKDDPYFLELNKIPKRHMKAYLEELQATNPEEYTSLRTSLKLFYKEFRAETLNFHESVIKAEDNIDSLRDYNTDIGAVPPRIILRLSNVLGSLPREDGRAVLSTREAQRNISDRSAYHEFIRNHFADLMLELKEEMPRSRKGVKKAFDYISIARDLDRKFVLHKANFEEAILAAVRPVPTRKSLKRVEQDRSPRLAAE